MEKEYLVLSGSNEAFVIPEVITDGRDGEDRIQVGKDMVVQVHNIQHHAIQGKISSFSWRRQALKNEKDGQCGHGTQEKKGIICCISSLVFISLKM